MFKFLVNKFHFRISPRTFLAHTAVDSVLSCKTHLTSPYLNTRELSFPRVIVSSPMSLRTLSGVESLRGVERTSSLPEERFMNTIPGHSAGARPSPFATEPHSSHFERRNSVPSKGNSAVMTFYYHVHFLFQWLTVVNIKLLLNSKSKE